MARIPTEILALARRHAAELDALDDAAMARVRRAMRAGVLRRRLDAQPGLNTRAGGEAAILDALARDLSGLAQAKLADALEEALAESTGLAREHVGEQLGAWLEHHGVPPEPPAPGALAAVSDELELERRQVALATYGVRVARKVRAALTESLAAGQGRDAQVAAVQGAMRGERWRAARIVRTELSTAYNQAHLEGLEDAREEGLEVKKTCIVTVDSRTAADSRPLDGQVRELDEDFGDGEGRRYARTPGRPNDRERLIAWIDESDAQAWSSGAAGAGPDDDDDETSEPEVILPIIEDSEPEEVAGAAPPGPPRGPLAPARVPVVDLPEDDEIRRQFYRERLTERRAELDAFLRGRDDDELVDGMREIIGSVLGQRTGWTPADAGIVTTYDEGRWQAFFDTGPHHPAFVGDAQQRDGWVNAALQVFVGGEPRGGLYPNVLTARSPGAENLVDLGDLTVSLMNPGAGLGQERLIETPGPFLGAPGTSQVSRLLRHGVGVYIHQPPTPVTVFHEIAHYADRRNRRVLEASVTLLTDRAQGRPLRTVVEATRTYQVYQGDFIHPYMGRQYLYENRRGLSQFYATELVTMSVEFLNDPERMAGFYLRDPEHFAHVVLAVEGGYGYEARTAEMILGLEGP